MGCGFFKSDYIFATQFLFAGELCVFFMEVYMEKLMMKEKSIVKLVLIMSLPNVLSMLVNSMYNIVDSFFVAKISENAMTALSLVFPMQNLVTSIGVGFGVGINALIALNLGANKKEQADCATSYGVLLSLIHGILLTVGCILLMPSFLRLFTSNQEVLLLGEEYSNVAFLFCISVNVGIALEKIFQAVGNMKTSMLVMITGCVINIILDPIFIFGYGIFPAMGIAGAALATGIGQSTILLLYIIIYQKKKLPVQISPKFLSYGKPIKKLYFIGVPATLNMALPSLLISFLNRILTAYSQIYVVILGIYYKLQTFVYLPANGIIQGIRPLISFNYGAKEHKRVQRIYHTALVFSLIIMFIGTILCAFFPAELMGMFTTNSDTISQGKIALQIISIGFMISAVSITTCGALEALGEGLASLIISALRYIIFIVPIAFFLSHLIGAKGVWHSFWITEFLACVISYLLYKKYFHFKSKSCSK